MLSWIFMAKKQNSEKTEIKKIENLLPFDLLKILGLRPKKIEEKYKKYANLNRRMMAITIDTTIIAVTIAPVMSYIIGFFVHTRNITFEEYNTAMSDEKRAISNLLRLLIETGKFSEFFVNFIAQILILIIFSGICWKIWAATPGKMLLRMKIVDAVTEKPINNEQIIIRNIGYIISGAVFFLGIFWISFNKKRQGWHDKMAGTVVIITNKKQSENDNITEKELEKNIEIAASVS